MFVKRACTTRRAYLRNAHKHCPDIVTMTRLGRVLLGTYTLRARRKRKRRVLNVPYLCTCTLLPCTRVRTVFILRFDNYFYFFFFLRSFYAPFALRAHARDLIYSPRPLGDPLRYDNLLYRVVPNRVASCRLPGRAIAHRTARFVILQRT
jgi:hypothetical protein